MWGCILHKLVWLKSTRLLMFAVVRKLFQLERRVFFFLQKRGEERTGKTLVGMLAMDSLLGTLACVCAKTS
jgi:hypothetical protein